MSCNRDKCRRTVCVVSQGAGITGGSSAAEEHQAGRDLRKKKFLFILTPNLAASMRVDHLVYATDNLARTVESFAQLTGVIPTRGGQHLGLGTRNELVGLGDNAYLEIIGPDLDQPAPAVARPFGIGNLQGEGLVAWCARPYYSIEETTANALAMGIDFGPAGYMSRRRPDGVVLSWRLTKPDIQGPLAPALPFLIDWLQSEHPTRSLGAPLLLVSLRVHPPKFDQISSLFTALNCDSRVTLARADRPSLAAELLTARGVVTLG